jgi:hypothetical protein
MGLDRLRVVRKQTPNQRRTAIPPSRQGISRENLVILGILRCYVPGAAVRQAIKNRAGLADRCRLGNVMPKPIEPVASPDDKKLWRRQMAFLPLFGTRLASGLR